MTPAPMPDVNARASDPSVHHAATKVMFERLAPTYDLVNRVLTAGIDARWRAEAVAALARAPRGAVLDVCAGTLDLAAAIAKARPADRIVAVDFSSAMLERGARKAPRVETRVADAMALPFDSGTFAAAACAFGMRNLADVARGAREVRRVLGPGGVFVTLDFFRPTRTAARAAHALLSRAWLPVVGGLLSGDHGAYGYLSRSMAGFFDRTGYEDLLRAAGFARVEGRDLTLGIASVVVAEVAA